MIQLPQQIGEGLRATRTKWIKVTRARSRVSGGLFGAALPRHFRFRAGCAAVRAGGELGPDGLGVPQPWMRLSRRCLFLIGPSYLFPSSYQARPPILRSRAQTRLPPQGLESRNSRAGAPHPPQDPGVRTPRHGAAVAGSAATAGNSLQPTHCDRNSSLPNVTALLAG